MEREEALKLVKENITKENHLKHTLAVEAIMRGVARHLNEDESKWGLAGLLHDIDFEKINNQGEKHTIIAEEILKGKVSDEIIKIIKSHNFEHTGILPNSKIENALIASDSVSGLVIACALVMPSKKLADAKVESISKRFKEKDFARACGRERILYCEKVGISKEKFFEIALQSLKEIATDLGL